MIITCKQYPGLTGITGDLLSQSISINTISICSEKVPMTPKNPDISSLPHALIYAGCLPFIAGALLLAGNVHSLPVLGEVDLIIATYGLVISVFLTGIHWGQQLSLGKAAKGFFIVSNILALSLWLAWLLLPTRIFLVFLAAPLLIILAMDAGLLKSGILNAAYFRTRIIITSMVILSLLCAAAML